MQLINHERLEDPLGETKKACAQMLNERDPSFTLPQPFYKDERVFAVDMQEIFSKEWLFAGMTCEVPKKGNYLTLTVGENPIVLVRGDKDAIHGFYNVCRHRGSKLCLQERGKAAKLVCPYHQWTYELDGRLLFAGSDMGEDFDMNAYGLKPIHVRVAGGFIFVCLSEGEAPSFDEFAETLDHYLEPYDMENTKIAVESNIVEDANWKLVIENNRECYHCNGSHPELLNSLIEFDDTDDPRATDDYKALVARKQADWSAESVPFELKRIGRRNRLTRTPLLNGVVSMTMDGKPGSKKLMGRLQSPDMGSLRILHLPNSWNHFMGDHAIVFRVLPLSAQKTLVTTKWLVHKDAVEGEDYNPDELRRVWDATNDQDRKLAEENQRGINSQAYQPGPYSKTYEFGVIDFLAWYSEQMIDNIEGDVPDLKLAKG
ncbi:aromatic ring-hydroxylating oxygenase subunit alpha [Larsenimonas suaedae]|uniref:Aromatic ring-hydroxylating dioxygenase subunit alpha n=1 Tax=Larsenimonas suaedae TaxID=1851019 RepID=A0ABU1GR77_9GAMM|nr:aromatic ring-hydroxylating dioxygenase subunit alpha [Larsenimonas suaedae]MCM2972677.1 aromatic ring-hydroxylating dioxygenase subunit alpha [Larsenimonas suaedae]MDR5894526.1 aromatic ring-hydroxylating dioxygenase subunit alpha [Larsenimonas suaedae]